MEDVSFVFDPLGIKTLESDSSGQEQAPVLPHHAIIIVFICQSKNDIVLRYVEKLCDSSGCLVYSSTTEFKLPDFTHTRVAEQSIVIKNTEESKSMMVKLTAMPGKNFLYRLTPDIGYLDPNEELVVKGKSMRVYETYYFSHRYELIDYLSAVTRDCLVTGSFEGEWRDVLGVEATGTPRSYAAQHQEELATKDSKEQVKCRIYYFRSFNEELKYPQFVVERYDQVRRRRYKFSSPDVPQSARHSRNHRRSRLFTRISSVSELERLGTARELVSLPFSW